MEIKVIIYVLIGVGYVIYSIYKSIQKQAEEKAEYQRRMMEQARLEAEARKMGHSSRPSASKPAQQPSAPVPTNKPVSLEDLLREFGMDTPEVTPAPAPIFEAPKKHTPVPPPAPVENKYSKYARIDYDENIEDEVAVAKKRQAEIDKEMKAVKEHGLDPESDFHLDPYKLGGRSANAYREWLKNPANMKKAFVASEIFNRKF